MRNFAQVDVFTSVPYRGNPLAVVVEADGMSDDEMAGFANWTNLSETTFLLPPTDPTADYRVRIFTPSTELPFAGHPTLGSCHAWLEAGGTPKRDKIVQECGVGLVSIRRDGSALAFAAPPLIRGGDPTAAELDAVCRVLAIDRSDVVAAQWADNGPGWIAVLLRSSEAVLALTPDFSALGTFDIGVAGPITSTGVSKIGVAGQTPEASLEVRAFFKESTHTGEDPVTGSLNASLAQWLLREGHMIAPYVAQQGTALGRSGQVTVTEAEGDIWVGGNCVTCVTGTVNL